MSRACAPLTCSRCDLPADPDAEWCPPGHGDLYAALQASGMLAEMLARGYRYAFVANADNLGAVLEPRILGWMVRGEIPFVMEVVQGTAADRKGGHIASHAGRLVLRDTAQAADDGSFTDFARWRFYNSNNLWIDLVALAELLDAHDGVLPLPLIVNRKTLPAAGEVVQLETAMGSAIGLIEGAHALQVPRTRFAPVKTTDDLLLVRSDAYELARRRGAGARGGGGAGDGRGARLGLLRHAAGPRPPLSIRAAQDAPLHAAVDSWGRRVRARRGARRRRRAARSGADPGRHPAGTGPCRVSAASPSRRDA